MELLHRQEIQQLQNKIAGKDQQFKDFVQLTGNERLEWKGTEKEKRELEDLLAKKNEELVKVRKDLDEADSRWKVENQYAFERKKQFKFLERKLLDYEWSTDQAKIDWFAAIKEAEKLVNEDRYENRFLGEVQELKVQKRKADNKLKKEEDLRKKAEKAVEKYEKRDQLQVEKENQALIDA